MYISTYEETHVSEHVVYLYVYPKLYPTWILDQRRCNGPLTRYVELRVAHAPGMPGTFSPPSQVSDPDMHHGTCVTDVPWCMPGSLSSDFLWSRWRGKRSRYSRRMHNPQFCVSGKRPMPMHVVPWCACQSLPQVTCRLLSRVSNEQPGSRKHLSQQF